MRAGRLRGAAVLPTALLLLVAALLTDGAQARLLGAEESLVGSWRVTSIVQEDGHTTTPVGMRMTFGADGTLTAPVGTLGTTTSRYLVVGRRPHAATLRVEDGDRRSQAIAEFIGAGVNLITDGTTLTLVRLPADTTAAPVAPPDPLHQHDADPAGTAVLHGQLDGADWTLVTVRPNLLQDSDGWHVVLLGEQLAPGGHEARTQVLVTVPRTIGRVHLSNAFNITFYTPPAANIACPNGYLEVLSVGDTVVSCALSAWLDQDHQLHGTFSFDPRRIPGP